ncbi:hypothetical protein M083_2132 [Bacteroides fragilis str. 3986 T(B)9]|uniref:Uncharacterized protein n=8 Tax=Bacteroides fragilis TaxID=817 RepID=A0A015XDE0_BACFG|nr:hypothetical protein M101_2045 [Bacteroides fragilis str. 1007-1-F \
MLSKEKKQKNGTTGKKSFYFCEVVCLTIYVNKTGYRTLC